VKSRPAKKSKMAGLGKVCPFLGKNSKNLLIFIHFPLDISPLDFYELQTKSHIIAVGNAFRIVA